jgi:3-hydroxymyristoyl/3-hydroxydecanoyl-(acyl carrier protein) dehydratase
MQPDALQSLVKAGKRRALWEPGPATREVDLGRDAVLRMLEHRDPFLFVETIRAVDLEQQALRGERTIAPGDPLFGGHFPGQPLYPGVLQLETMGQYGLCLLHLAQAGRPYVEDTDTPRAVRALRIHHALFLEAVAPGDRLEVMARTVSCDDYTAVCAGQIRRGGQVCALAVMEVYFVHE